MAFTAQEISNIANAAIDYYIKGKPMAQTIQDKPLLKAMKSAQKTFPGGKGNISIPVKGAFNSYFKGYSHDDTVTYVNPANIKRVAYPWKELHGGISITHSELKYDGISVSDTDGKKTTDHSDREKTALVNLLQDKLDDMDEGMSRDMNRYFWGDGSVDAQGPVGVRAYLPTVKGIGVTGGIDRATNAWWQHLVFNNDSATAPYLAGGGGMNGATNATVPLPLQIQKCWRQLRRFGGKPNLWLAGSAFIEALEANLYGKGTFTTTGFNSNGKTDVGLADIAFKGNVIQYDPTLDDDQGGGASFSKYCYMIDTSKLYPYIMDGEDMKQHSPTRPAEKYVLYRGVTWTGNMVCTQLNANAVLYIA